MLATLCLAILAQDPAIEAWENYMEARKAVTAAQTALNEARRKEGTGRAAVEKAFLALSAEEVDKLDPETHAELLDLGWTAQADRAIKAGDVALAESIYVKFFERLPKGASADRNRMSYGDLLAAVGRTNAALTQYRQVPKTSAAYSRYAEQRLAVVGQPAAEINSATWLGGDPKPLSSFKGRPVVIDFWATWCGPCRAVMPGLNELFATYKEQGLVVLGVTRYYNNGYMPENPQQMMSGGKRVDNIEQNAFLPHVEAFRTNTGIDYPFVIGTEQDAKNYKVSGIPTLAVVDREGKVAMLLVGSGSEPLLKVALKRLLQTDAEPKPAKP